MLGGFCGLSSGVPAGLSGIYHLTRYLQKQPPRLIILTLIKLRHRHVLLLELISGQTVQLHVMQLARLDGATWATHPLTA